MAFSQSPASADIHVYPGQEGVVPIYITSDQGEILSFDLFQAHISETDDISFSELNDEQKDIYRIEYDSISVAADVEEMLQVYISAPTSGEGDDILALVARSEKQDGDISINEAIATMIFVSYGNEPKRNAVFTGLSTPKNVYGDLPVDIFATVSNTGDIIARPIVEIQIKNLLGRNVAVLRPEDVRTSISPGTERQYHFIWDDDRDTLFSPFGYYTIDAQFASVIGASFESYKKSIVIVPWKGLLILFALAALILAIMKVVKKRLHAIS